MGSRGRGHPYQARFFLCHSCSWADRECGGSHIEVWARLSMGRWHGRPDICMRRCSWNFFSGIFLISMLWGRRTSRHPGPEIRIIAIPALPGAVDTAYMVSSTGGATFEPLLITAWPVIAEVACRLVMTGAWRLGLRKSSPIHGGLWRERLERLINTQRRVALLATAAVLAFICNKYIPPTGEVVMLWSWRRTRLKHFCTLRIIWIGSSIRRCLLERG